MKWNSLQNNSANCYSVERCDGFDPSSKKFSGANCRWHFPAIIQWWIQWNSWFKGLCHRVRGQVYLFKGSGRLSSHILKKKHSTEVMHIIELFCRVHFAKLLKFKSKQLSLHNRYLIYYYRRYNYIFILCIVDLIQYKIKLSS